MITAKRAVIRKKPALPVYVVAAAIIALMIAANVVSVNSAEPTATTQQLE